MNIMVRKSCVTLFKFRLWKYALEIQNKMIRDDSEIGQIKAIERNFRDVFFSLPNEVTEFLWLLPCEVR